MGSAFADWFDDTMSSGRLDALADYQQLAPYAVRNYRTEEHLLPLFVALGGAGESAVVRRLHPSRTHGVPRIRVTTTWSVSMVAEPDDYENDGRDLMTPGLC